MKLNLGQIITSKNIWTGIPIVLLLLFIVSLFANISHPLLWNDESETVMYGSRILDYGYPKVHDEGNRSIYLLADPIAVKEGLDAYVGTSWAQFYFATIGVSLAKPVENIFWKTALVRIPFAFAGLLGLFILAILFSGFFENFYHKRLFFSFFLLFELLSVSLVLHLREARYYPLVILSISCIFCIFIRHNFFKRFSALSYTGFMTASLLLAFMVFYPLYFAFMATFALWESYRVIKTAAAPKLRLTWISIWELIKPAGYFPISIFATLPLLVFFKNVQVAKAFRATASGSGFNLMYANISNALLFFKNYEFLLLYITARAAVLSLAFIARTYESRTKKILQLSNFLSLFVFCYFVAVSSVPFFFERYYIGLQPILTVILFLDLYVLFALVSKSHSGVSREKIIFTVIFTSMFVYSAVGKIDYIQGHIYEMLHPYRGPLDYAIPYIQNNFTETSNLVIATDYEELVPAYYLGSRTIIGQLLQNVDEDQKSPDVIIPRNILYPSGNQNHPGVYDEFFTKARYRKITFPVKEYPYNNIPELYYSYPHVFKTLATEDQENAFAIYVKESD
ncbi:MAG: hypothetical protein KW788_00010 [Candidatus Doudnabacteria bacterium]|nr:hypothetical protein [Candidatus Doudnabacteria bacterium]